MCQKILANKDISLTLKTKVIQFACEKIEKLITIKKKTQVPIEEILINLYIFLS
jgi:hypothetical protein